MARSITARLKLEGRLRTLTPLHVGGCGAAVESDLPLARNGAGRWYIPGTSLAGALREWCIRAFGRDAVNSLWGYQDPVHEDKGEASYVVVADSVLPENVAVEVRDGVGIDRISGRAADQIKYDRAVLPRGTLFDLAVTTDCTDEGGVAQEMLQSLQAALEAGAIRLGAAKTRGLGSVRLEGATLVRHVLNTKTGMLTYLRGDNGAAVAALEQPREVKSRLWVTIDWEPLGPVMVKAGADGVGVDMQPLVSRREDGLSLVLPGSSVKGIIRSQAERIVRTLHPEVKCVDVDGKTGKLVDKKPLEQIEARAKNDQAPSLIEMLFGSPGRKENGTPVARLGLGALSVNDCYGKQAITDAQWRLINQADPGVTDAKSLRKELRDAGLETWSAAYHVAVDRWTGGAAESFLYTVLEPTATRWDPLHLELDLHRLDETERDPAMALLLFVLRDLAAGRLALGFATQRGMGAVRVNAIRCQFAESRQGWGDLRNQTLFDSKWTLPGSLQATLQEAWKAWTDGKHKLEVKS